MEPPQADCGGRLRRLRGGSSVHRHGGKLGHGVRAPLHRPGGEGRARRAARRHAGRPCGSHQPRARLWLPSGDGSHRRGAGAAAGHRVSHGLSGPLPDAVCADGDSRRADRPAAALGAGTKKCTRRASGSGLRAWRRPAVAVSAQAVSHRVVDLHARQLHGRLSSPATDGCRRRTEVHPADVGRAARGEDGLIGRGRLGVGSLRAPPVDRGRMDGVCAGVRRASRSAPR